MSGYVVFNNSFEDCQVGMFIGGGRHNAVLNNTFRDCDTAVHIDSRGHGCFDVHCFPNCPGNCDASAIWGAVGNVTTAPNGTILRLGPIKTQYRTPPWSTQFPDVLHLLDHVPGTALGDPVYNTIAGNDACGCGTFLPATCSGSGKPCSDDIVKTWKGTVEKNTVYSNCSISH